MSAHYSPFEPPRRILMGPGPSGVSARVLLAMARPTVGHLDPDFLELMDEVAAQLREIFGTENRLTVPISGTGSAGMETAFVNLLEPGDCAIIGVNGVFGQRMKDVAERAGARVVAVEAAWGEPLDVRRLINAHKANPRARLLAVVHAETSTGVQQPLDELAGYLRGTGTLFLVDTVTSLGGVPVNVDAWGIDVAYSGTQKCLSVPPGLAPITLSERAVERVRSRSGKVQSWYLDLSMISAYWGSERVYHHTAPINALYGLHEGLCAILEEGLEARYERHRRWGGLLQRSLMERGLELLVEEPYRLPQLTSVRVPAGVDDKRFRRALLERYGIEIGGGLGPLAGKVWRIGLMGETCREQSVMLFLSALDELVEGRG
ncbi:MAG: alanine--glyoxylate aminotransferase family protein [Gemmatimonadota bacterium]|nr:MAG: alanine--glyoxylate aminotransferase family protein [Gemmatimonadota bacterium]